MRTTDLSRRMFLAGLAGACVSGFRGPERVIERRGESAASMWLRARRGFREGGRQARPLEGPDPDPQPPAPEIDWALTRDLLHARYPDIRRHFVFEYYPWYASDPYRHWDEQNRQPPVDIAATAVPLLGAYDSRSVAVMEQHARWIADAGVGAINVSWWGPGSFCDRAVPRLMDVMAAHDIRVTFHLEPYRDDRAQGLVDDIIYLVREYGDRRGWDAFLLLPDANGTVGPVLKSFRTIVPSAATDCLGRTFPVPDYTPDDVWRWQTDRLRNELRGSFDRITLLADSLDMLRTVSGGFDGIAIYDNYVPPAFLPVAAEWCARADLLFSFNVNPGADPVLPWEPSDDPCYVPARFEPDIGAIGWSEDEERTRARATSEDRMRESFTRTIQLQLDPASPNARRGFFLVYVNSFNEWHEGHQFEPMKRRADLSEAESERAYHNVDDGDYRLRYLRQLLGLVL